MRNCDFMLGTLYHPKALALETAKAVLQVDNPYAVNPALGCENGCLGCYGPLAFHKHDWDHVKIAKPEARFKFERQVRTTLSIPTLDGRKSGAFIAFGTDPLLPQVIEETRYRTFVLKMFGVKTALLSKLTYPAGPVGQPLEYQGDNFLNGKSIVTFDEEYYKVYEPRAASPQRRLGELLVSKHPWISCEPYPPPAIHRQDPKEFLRKLFGGGIWNCRFPEVIVFGMRNYDKRALTEDARIYYRDTIEVFDRYCKDIRVRLHVKSDTLSYVRGE